MPAAQAAINWGVSPVDTWPNAAHHQAAVNAMTAAAGRFNTYGQFTPVDYVYVFYNAGVPTADGSYSSSDIRFGGTYPNERVTLHELAHVLGSGTTSQWNNRFSGGVWTGPQVQQLIKQFDGEQAELRQSGVHFYPYGLNYDSEYSDLNAQRSVALVYAMRADMGLGPTAHPSSATSVTLTGSDPYGESGFNAHYRWSDGYFAHAGADYRTGAYLMRTPQSPNSFTFAGESLTLDNPAVDTGLYFKGEGSTGVITIPNLVLDGGWVDHRGSNNLADLFQLAGNVHVESDSNIRAFNGNIHLLADLHGTGTLTIRESDTITQDARYVVSKSSSNTFTGNLVNRSRYELAIGANFNFVIEPGGVSNSISGSTARATRLNGEFRFDLAAASANVGDSWNLVTAANTTYGSTFEVAGFDHVGGVWSNGDYIFSQSSGILAPVTQWANSGSGAWHSGANWSAGEPLVGGDAKFGSAITAPATVAINSPVEVSRLTFDSFHQYTLVGTGPLTLVGAREVNTKLGTHEFATPVSGDGGLTKRGGGTLVLSASNTFTGETRIVQGKLRIAHVDALATTSSIDIHEGATLEVSPLAGGIEIKGGQSLAVAGEASLVGEFLLKSGSSLRVGGAGLPVVSAPQLIDNFDSYTNASIKTIGSHASGDVTGGKWTGVFNGTGAATIENDSTPASPDDNVLQANGVNSFGASDWRGAVTNLAVNYDTDFTFRDNTENTLFFQFKATTGTGNYDTMFGLTNSTANVDNNNAWQDFAVMPYLSGGGVGAADLRAEVAGGATATAISNIAGDTWYNVWLVVNAQANTYDIYTSTGPSDGTLAVSGAVFRNGLGLGDLAAFGIAQREGGRIQIDNLYRLDGRNVGNPLVAGGGFQFASEVVEIEGDLTLESGAVLMMDIATPSVGDRLNINGQFTAGGTLEVFLDNRAILPSLGSAYDLFDFTTALGTFDLVYLPSLGAGLRWDTSQLLADGTLAVVQALAGDFNGDGIVNLADYTVWRDVLGSVEDAQSLAGNGTGDNIVDATDYLLWRANFGSTLENVTFASQQVPEPGTLVLACAMVVAATALRTRRNVASYWASGTSMKSKWPTTTPSARATNTRASVGC
ncbi:autotransporter-associated beta strand repeat-containing protein [Aeoliella sp. SH292]|uniref:autotransporter-associated beta strand repeat-containing protein n=1 Tax=Aeoliella sp. SH292 TaxID=3454464 RepID=UPI003F9682B5